MRREAHSKLLAQAATACERIKTSPMPLGYVSALRFFLVVWLVTLPLTMIGGYGWLATPAVTFIAFLFLVAAREFEPTSRRRPATLTAPSTPPPHRSRRLATLTAAVHGRLEVALLPPSSRLDLTVALSARAVGRTSKASRWRLSSHLGTTPTTCRSRSTVPGSSACC